MSTALKTGDRTLQLIADHPYVKPAGKFLKFADKAAIPLAVLATGVESVIDLTDKNKTDTEKAADVTYDVAENAGLFALGSGAGSMTAALILSTAICPECTMLAAAGGLAVGVGLPIAVDLGFEELHLKEELEREIGGVEDFTDEAMDETVDAAYITGDAVKDATYATGDAIKDVGNQTADFAKDTAKALNPSNWF